MKIEMGESLFYSWLRHVKGCQIVQTNWKVSSKWSLLHESDLEEIKRKTEIFFKEKYGYEIYKKNASLSQIIQQAECDAIGTSFNDIGIKTYAVDVAFHEFGLQYGSKDATVMKIVNKCIRTAMCLYGYFNIQDAEILFASPKINNSTLSIAIPCIQDAQSVLEELGYKFTVRIVANQEFKQDILNPVLNISSDVADTNELFLRSYQMLKMFDGN